VNPLNFLLMCLAGMMNREQQLVIEYLQEEVAALKELLEKWPRFTNRQRKRLAIKATRLRWTRLKQIANVVAPQTLLRWHRTLVGKKYDSSNQPRVGRSATKTVIAELVVQTGRHHQGLESQIICPRFKKAGRAGEVVRHERLGGLLNFYSRKAA